MEGYIAIHRKILEWGWYSNVNVRIVFIHLLIVANHANVKWQGIDVKRGQRVTSYASLSSEVGLSVQNVRTAIKKLISTGEISVKPTNKYILITINNYNEYQLGQQNQQSNSSKINNQNNTKLTSNQQTNNMVESIDNTTFCDSHDKQTNKQLTINQQANQQSTNKQLTTNNNDNNDKENKNDNNISRTSGNVQDTSKQHIDYNLIVTTWNNLGLKQVQKLTEQRKKAIRSRVKEYGIDEVITVINKVKESDFLQGKKNDFEATFDWIIGPKNFIKVLEDNYSNNKNLNTSNNKISSKEDVYKMYGIGV